MMGDLPTLLAVAGTLVLGALALGDWAPRAEPIRVRPEDPTPPQED